MNVTIDRDSLAWLVQTASRPIPSRSTIPAIKGCLIEAFSDRLVLSGTNLDWGVRVSARASVLAPGSLVVSSKILEDVVRTISNPQVNLTLDTSAWALVVRSGTSEMVLNAVPADDFPQWPEQPRTNRVMLRAQLLQDLVRVGSTFAVSNPARPLWGACLVEFKDGKIIVVSTDQFALSRARADLKASPAKAIIPASVLQDITRLANDDDEIEMNIGENHVYFSSESWSSFSRLIEGQYYAYEQVIPRNFAATARVPSEALLRAASRAAIVASEEDRAMRMSLNKEAGTLTIRAGSPEKGRMEEQIPAIITGESIELWVQHKYVLQAVSRISTEETLIGISGQVSPMKIEPVPADSPGADYVDAAYVIMPMSSPRGAF